MITQPYQPAVDLMVRHENAMLELYSLYASQHEGRHWDFWHQLAKEEGSHADMVKLMGVSLEQGQANFNEGRFKTEQIEKSLEYIGQKIIEAQADEVDLLDALAAAVEIEDSFIEHEYFSILDEDPENLKSILELLQKGASSHQLRVREAWEQAKAAAVKLE